MGGKKPNQQRTMMARFMTDVFQATFTAAATTKLSHTARQENERDKSASGPELERLLKQVLSRLQGGSNLGETTLPLGTMG